MADQAGDTFAVFQLDAHEEELRQHLAIGINDACEELFFSSGTRRREIGPKSWPRPA